MIVPQIEPVDPLPFGYRSSSFQGKEVLDESIGGEEIFRISGEGDGLGELLMADHLRIKP